MAMGPCYRQTGVWFFLKSNETRDHRSYTFQINPPHKPFSEKKLQMVGATTVHNSSKRTHSLLADCFYGNFCETFTAKLKTIGDHIYRQRFFFHCCCCSSSSYCNPARRALDCAARKAGPLPGSNNLCRNH